MKRDYADGVRDDVIYFTGVEVENTPQKGAHTLFVVGIRPFDEVISMAERKVARHIYLGANQSVGQNATDGIVAHMNAWDDLACALLDRNYWVTFDFDQVLWPDALGMRAMEHPQFIPQVSVKLPSIMVSNYNTCIKLDDTDFKATNPGVWVHQLRDLMSRSTFTSWDAYTGDEQI